MKNAKKQWSISLLVLAVLLIVGWLAASPYYAMYALGKGIDNEDKDALEEVVDFPVLRQNLKDTLSTVITSKMTKEAGDNPFAALGMMMANAMIDPMINSMVTPAGLAKLSKKELPQPGEKNVPTSTTPQESSESESLTSRNYKLEYETMNRVAVRPEGVEDPPVFIFKRDVLFWRLVDVRLNFPE